MARAWRLLKPFEARHAIPLAVLWVFAGCYMSYRDFSDGEMPDVYVPDEGVAADGDAGAEGDADAAGDADARADADGDAGADGDADARADAEADVGADEASDGDAGFDAVECTGAWLDPTTGYLWENPPSETRMTWYEGTAYCEELSLCGHAPGEWRLPTISESRSLIRECPGTVTGGDCGVTDSCLTRTPCYSPSCYSCPVGRGPGVERCYQPPALEGRCGGAVCEDAYWSSSQPDDPSYGWIACFGTGSLDYIGTTYSLNVRCIHTGP